MNWVRVCVCDIEYENNLEAPISHFNVVFIGYRVVVGAMLDAEWNMSKYECMQECHYMPMCEAISHDKTGRQL